MTWQHFYITVEPATADSAGAIVEGSFAVDGDKVRVRNDRGKLIGSAEYVPGEDAALVARRILRRGTVQSDFNRPLPAARVPD